MIGKTSCPGLAGKTRGSLFPAILILFILTSLILCVEEAWAVTWTAQGPSPILGGDTVIVPDNPVVGAVESLLIDPNDNNTMYAGAVNGGIWKTTNGGTTWTPLTDGLTSLSMAGMALDPGNPDRILAGFGNYSNFGGKGGPRVGVIFSSDAGNTWKSVGGAVTTNTDVSAVLVNGQTMFVASRSFGEGGDTSVPGLFRSTDGGASFIKIDGSGGLPKEASITSLASDPSNPNRLYAAVQDSPQNAGIFRSDDLGKTWTNITPAGSGIGSSTANIQNIQLSVGAKGQSLFMCLAIPMGTNAKGLEGNQLQSVWRSLDQGATWQNMGGQGPAPSQGLPGTIENGAFIGINNDGQAKINLAILADPQKPNIVYIAGDDQPAWDQINKDTTRTFPNQIGATNHTASIYRGDASKDLSNPPAVDNWTPTTSYDGQWRPITDNFAANSTTPHSDGRTLTFDSLGNLLETSDGGINRRTLPQSSNGQWTSLIGNLQITEIYGLAYDNNTHTLISSNQDVGTSAQNQNSNGTPSSTWTTQLGADGGSLAVNDYNSAFSVRYISSQALGDFTRIKVDLNNNIIEKVPTKLKVGTEDLKTGASTDVPRQAPVRVNQADQMKQENKTQLAIGTTAVYLAKDDISGSLSPDLCLTQIHDFGKGNQVGDIAYFAPHQQGKEDLLLVAEEANLWLSTELKAGSLHQLTNYPTTSGTITSVSINPNFDDANSGTYRFYTADGSVVRSTEDGGSTWTTGLSLYQLRSLQFVSKGSNNFLVAGGYGTLYAAREADLYNWYSLKGNLPNTFIWQMAYSSQDDILAVGATGRGAFTVDNASTLMPVTTPTSVDTGWIRLLRGGSGDQTLNGGTVQLPEPLLNWVNNLTLTALGGTFDTAQSDATLSGKISGLGSLTITGNGRLFLQNTNNDYAGGTNVNGATVVVTSDANLGAASGGLSFDGGTLQTDHDFTSARNITLLPYGGTWNTFGSNSTLSGIISGPGTLTKFGYGTLTLTGMNTYSGGTILQGGTLKVSQDDNLGAAGGPVSFNGGTLRAMGGLTTSRTLVVLGNGGTLDTGGFDSVFSGELFGYGTFTQTGAGSLKLTGDGSPFAGTYTVSSGAFTLNNVLGSVPGPSNLMVNAGSSFSGNGSLVGSVNLQGDGSGFAGSVEVPSTRMFTLDNILGGNPSPSTVVVDPGGLITGSGTVVGTLTNKGTISPGNSPGTLNVVGSYTQTASGTYMAEIASASSYDRIAVTGAPGTADLAGTLSPVLLNGYRPPGNTVFPGLVTATGGISGTFSSLTNQMLSPTLFWQPRYGANSFDLVVQRDYTNQGLGLNSNHLAVGNMLNGVAGTTSGDLNNVLNAVDSLPNASTVQDAYKQISPEKAGALANLGFVAANFQVRNLATRTTNLRFVQGGSGGTASSLAPGGVSCNYSKLSGVMLAYNGGFLPDLLTARRKFKAPESRWGIFADGGAAFGTQSSTSNQTGYNFTLGGLTLGADYRVTDKLLVGLATGYSNTASSFYGTGGSVTVNTIPFNAYGAYFSGPLYVYGSLGYALNLYNLRRDINFDGIGRTATSSTTGNQFNLYGEAGYDLKLSRMILTPAATLTYSALWLGGFSEENAGALNLNVGPQNASSVQTGVGGRVTLPLRMGSIIMVPQAYAFYQHEFANGSRGLNASLSQGSTFTWQTDAAGQNFALVGASLTAGLRENLYAQVNFNAEVGRRNATAQFINAGLRYEF
jgi:autotransporter-associated beta strand protein